MGLYENRRIELQEVIPKMSKEETNASVLADLHQRQKVEFDLKVQELQGKVWYKGQYYCDFY